MRKRVRVTRDAERDLDEIWLYIAQDSVDAASNLLDEFMARFIFIGAFPKMGRTRDELKDGLRCHPVGKYVIYYREMRDHISILHVVHGARDPRRVFNRRLR